MFMVLNASESRSLRRREGALVADLLNERHDTPARSDDNDLYSSFHNLRRVPSASASGSLPGSSSMMTSMSRAFSALSAKTSAIFQRKRIPEFTVQENDVVVICNELPRIIVTPADNVLYNLELPISPTGHCSLMSPLAPQLVPKDELGGVDLAASVEMRFQKCTPPDEGCYSTTSSAPSSVPSTPSQCYQELPYSMGEDEMDATPCSYNAGRVSSRQNQQIQRGVSVSSASLHADELRLFLQRDDEDSNMAPEKDECRDASLDTLASTEIDLMFHREGKKDIVDEYHTRRVGPPSVPVKGNTGVGPAKWIKRDNTEDGISSVRAGSEELTSSVEFVPTYTTVLQMMKQTSCSGSL